MITKILFAVNTVISLLLIFFGDLWLTLIKLYLPLGAKLVYSHVMLAVYVLEAVLLVVFLTKLAAKYVRPMLIAVICGVAATLLICYIPVSPLTTELLYKANENRREEFVQNFEKHQLEQINTGTYYVGDIRLSHSGTVRIAENGDSLKIMLLLNKTLSGSRMLIYSSDGTEPTEGEFYGFTLTEYGPIFSDVEKRDGNWYMVTVK